MLDPKLKEKLKEDFNENGVYFPIDVLTESEVEYFKSSFLEHERLLGDRAIYSSFAQLHLHFPWAYKLVMHPNIVECVTSVLGPNVLVHGSTLFHKSPNDQKFVSWHQDSYNMMLDTYDYISAWIGLAESTIENGCLRVIPGTHKQLYDHFLNPTEHNLLKRGTTVDVSAIEDRAIDVELSAGQMSLHHVNTIHGSNANTSGIRRMGFAIRYITDKVSQRSPHHKLLVASGDCSNTPYQVQNEIPEGSLEECIVKQKLAHAAYVKELEESRQKQASK